MQNVSYTVTIVVAIPAFPICFLRRGLTLTWCGIMTNPKCDPTEHDNQVSWNVGLDQEEANAPLKLEPDY